jgi:apolipoprotein N-acyltransferase
MAARPVQIHGEEQRVVPTPHSPSQGWQRAAQLRAMGALPTFLHGVYGALLAGPLYAPWVALGQGRPALIGSAVALLLLAHSLHAAAHQRHRRRDGLALMLAACLGYQLLAMHWLNAVLKPELPAAQLGLACAMLLLLVLPQVLLWSLFQLAAARLRRRLPVLGAWPELLSWPMAWVCWSLVKEPLWLGGQYGALALVTLDWPIAQSLLPWCGAALWEGLLWSAALLFWQLRQPLSRLLLLTVFALPWRAPASMAETAAPEPVRLVAVQPAAAETWNLQVRDVALDQLHRALQGRPAGTVLVTTEAFLKETPPHPPTGVWADFVETLVQAQHHALIGSVLDWPAPRSAKPATLNAVLQYSPTPAGARRSIYGKQRLAPAGETVPWPWLIRPLLRRWVDQDLQSEIDSAPPAMGQRLFVGEQIVGLSICHELAFSTQIAAAAQDAGWLVNVSDDRWIPDPSYRLQALALARLRTLELRKPLLRVSSGGASTLFDANGRLQGQAPGGGALHWDLQLQAAQSDSFFGRRHRGLHAAAVASLAGALGIGFFLGLGSSKSEAI